MKHNAVGLIAACTFLTLSAATMVNAQTKSDPKVEFVKQRRAVKPRAPRTDIALSSPYVEVAVNEFGEFTMGTRIGDPANPGDDNKRMLYGHPDYQGTGELTLRIDGENYTYGTLPDPVDPPTTFNGVNTTIWMQSGIQLVQQLQLVRGTATGNEDALQMTWIVQNSSGSDHTVGFRTMLDTWLGNTDGAPFRVPGYGDVTHEFELSGAQIPQYWQGFDQITNPSMRSQGTLQGGLATKPDRIIWGWWPMLVSTPWGYTVDPDTVVTSDSAVAMYWNEQVLPASGSRVFTSYYGVTAIDTDLRQPAATGLFAPALLELVGGQLSPNPFTVTAYLENTVLPTSQTLNNLYARLQLPTGFVLEEGQTALHQLGNLDGGWTTQTSWLVRVTTDTFGVLPCSLFVGATGQPEKQVSRNVSVPERRAAADPAWNLYSLLQTPLKKEALAVALCLKPDAWDRHRRQ